MVSDYRTEEEQIEAIKEWWNENGTAIIIGITLGLALLFGWRTWESYSTRQAESASIEYQVVLANLENGQVERAREAANKLLSEHSRSPYASLASLNLARQDVEEGNLASAHVRLQWVIEQDHLPELTHLARLRKARLYLSESALDKAKQTIAGIEEGTFKPSYSELRGDIAMVQKDFAAAKTAYQQALEGKELGAEHRRLLQLKLDDLGQGVVIAAVPPTVTLQSDLATPSTTETENLTTPVESNTISEPLTFPLDLTAEPGTF